MENTELDNSEKKSGNTKIVVLIIMILALLGGVGYLAYNTSEQNVLITQKDATIKVTKDSLSSKIKEIENLSLELQQAADSLSAKGQDITALEEQIRKMEGRIAAAKRGERSAIKGLTELKLKYESLLAFKDHQIDSLKGQIDTLRTQVTGLEKDKLVLGDTILNLRNVTSDLTEKISLAAVLRAENIKVAAFTNKGKAIPKEPFKAKAIHKLSVSFTLADNKIAKKDNKPVMMRLVEPNGAVLFDNATGGGTFTTTAGKELPYTATEDLAFSNSKQKVTFNYVKGSPFKPGNYSIEVFAEGHEIGDGKFVVK
jgi:DNA repair ATPase RecN